MPKYQLKTGDLVFARTGATVGKSYLIGKSIPETVFASYLIRIQLIPIISYRLVYNFFKSQLYWKQINKSMAGIGQPNVNGQKLAKIYMPFPPLPEQHRIVSKIEELFTNLDAGTEALKKVKARIKRYRQAVLKYAFEGKLTEKWREDHKNELEPASVLLEKIKEERKKKVKGKKKELPVLDTSELPELPAGWGYFTLNDIATNKKNSIKRGPFGSSIKKEFFVSSGYKVYEQKNVIYNNFKLGSYYISKEKFNELKDFEVSSGDILVSCSGTIGKITVAPKDLEKGIINQALLKITLDDTKVYPKFFVFLFKSKINEILEHNTRGSAMKNIASVRVLKQMEFPLSSFVEQYKIIEQIDYRFSIADKVEKIIDESLKKAERLRQSILKQAFEGKLVPQDPKDEPVERLLERIKAEKARLEVEKKATQKKRKSGNKSQNKSKQMRLYDGK